MTTSQIKSELNKTIAGLSASKLKKVYGLVNNIATRPTDDDWAPEVSKEEIEAIEAGIAEHDSGKKIPYKQAMESLKRRNRK